MKNTVLILAAGIGSRVSKLTHGFNGCLLPIDDIAIISKTISLFDPDDKIIIVTGYDADDVEAYIRATEKIENYNCTFVRVKEFDGPNASIANSILAAKPYIHSPFYLMYGNKYIHDYFDFKISSISNKCVNTIIAQDIYESNTCDKFEHYLIELDDKGFVKPIGEKELCNYKVKNKFEYQGHAFIQDWELFFNAYKESDYNISELDDMAGIKNIMNNGGAFEVYDAMLVLDCGDANEYIDWVETDYRVIPTNYNPIRKVNNYWQINYNYDANKIVLSKDPNLFEDYKNRFQELDDEMEDYEENHSLDTPPFELATAGYTTWTSNDNRIVIYDNKKSKYNGTVGEWTLLNDTNKDYYTYVLTPYLSGEPKCYLRVNKKNEATGELIIDNTIPFGSGAIATRQIENNKSSCILFNHIPTISLYLARDISRFREFVNFYIEFALNHTVATTDRVSGIIDLYNKNTIDIVNYFQTEHDIEDNPLFINGQLCESISNIIENLDILTNAMNMRLTSFFHGNLSIDNIKYNDEEDIFYLTNIDTNGFYYPKDKFFTIDKFHDLNYDLASLYASLFTSEYLLFKREYSIYENLDINDEYDHIEIDNYSTIWVDQMRLDLDKIIIEHGLNVGLIHLIAGIVILKQAMQYTHTANSPDIYLYYLGKYIMNMAYNEYFLEDDVIDYTLKEID